MYHFPASSSAQRSLSEHSHGHSKLNATQSKSASNPLFLKIEEELHDARRVRDHGQEEDLRYALDMVIGRVSELTNTLSEAYKAQAELEIQLNLARSNLQVIQMNNEMLEDALKKNNVAARDLGWNRRSGAGLERSQSVDYPPESPASATSESKFFKFRFAGSQGTQSVPASGSRPGTPVAGGANLTSPSMPSLTAARDREKELEDLQMQLEKEKAAKKKALEDKAALEDELESLSQALFEEANKMVAEERMKLSETLEELNETRAEKEALQSALRLLDNQTRSSRESHHLRTSSSEFSLVNASSSSSTSNSPLHSPKSSRHLRSSSQQGLKSVPTSPLSDLPPLPPSPFPSRPSSTAYQSDWSPPPRKDSLLAPLTEESAMSPTATIKKKLSASSIVTYTGLASINPVPSAGDSESPDVVEDSQPTPRYNPPPLSASTPDLGLGPVDDPWADVPSSESASTIGVKATPASGSETKTSDTSTSASGTEKDKSVFDSAIMAAAYAGIR